MIPNQVEGWLVGGPWKIVSGYSWKKKDPKPFHAMDTVSVRHEIAHLVACPEQDIFDPLWGLEFNKILPPKELEVLCISGRIMLHTEYPFNSSMKPEALLYFKDMFPPDISNDIHNLTETYLEQWSLENVWSECQRKYEMIRSSNV